jgi:hypothetical protein
MTTQQIVDLARKHDSNSNSGFCFNEVMRAFYQNKPEQVALWAAQSLKHSVGIFHPAYKAVKEN